jgi:hypothetical protein
MFSAALCTIAKLWKEPGCPTTNQRIKENMVFIKNRILLSHKEE